MILASAVTVTLMGVTDIFKDHLWRLEELRGIWWGLCVKSCLEDLCGKLER